MEASPIHGKLSADALLRLLSQLTPQQILELPLDRLPESIPEDLADELDPAREAALSHLMGAHAQRQLQRHIRLEGLVGREAAKAIQNVDNYFKRESLSLFRRSMADLADLAKKHNDLKALAPSIKRIAPQVMNVRQELALIERTAQDILDCVDKDLELAPDMRLAATCLKAGSELMNRKLGKYLTLRLQVARMEMNRYKKRIDNAEMIIGNIVTNIELLSQEMRDHKKKKGFLSRLRKHKPDESEVLIRGRIGEMTEVLKKEHVMIDESALMQWLDTLVEVTLHKEAHDLARDRVRQARTTLYAILNQYCVDQERSAKQIAENPFLLSEPKDAMHYILQSETFILNYFKTKRESASGWLSNAASMRIDDLTKLERDLVRSLRQNMG